jgi:hypothetical protein
LKHCRDFRLQKIAPHSTIEVGSVPIYVTFYHLDRTMVGRTEGEVTLADLMGYLDDVEKAKAVGYAKIFDCSQGQASLMPAERDIFGSRLADYHARYGGRQAPSPWSRAPTSRPASPISMPSFRRRTPAR